MKVAISLLISSGTQINMQFRQLWVNAARSKLSASQFPIYAQLPVYHGLLYRMQ